MCVKGGVVCKEVFLLACHSSLVVLNLNMMTIIWQFLSLPDLCRETMLKSNMNHHNISIKYRKRQSIITMHLALFCDKEVCTTSFPCNNQ